MYKNTVKSDKRERIMESGMLLFAKNGYHNVSMDDVARKAQVAKGTVYLYFVSKEDLYVSIVCSNLRELLKFVQESFDKQDTYEQRLRNYVTHIYVYLSGKPCFFKIWKEIGHGCLFGDVNEIRILKKKMHNILMSCIPGGNGVRRGLYSDLIIGSIEAAVERTIVSLKTSAPVNNKDELDSVIYFIFNALDCNVYY
ncbi:TetR/AcrR family transcriptional regulator [bacterium]|nr:TetR/AcrR family transcriptional regulator [bacterium]